MIPWGVEPAPSGMPPFRGIRYPDGDLMAEGRFQGVFDRSYALDDIVEAFRYVENGQKTGIVVINVR